MFTRRRFARLRLLHSGSLRITSLFFAVDRADDDAPLQSQVRFGPEQPLAQELRDKPGVKSYQQGNKEK
jgi:hypothetical protein